MSLSVHKVAVVGRAALILTTGAVATAIIPVNQTLDGWLMVYCNFTIGSLTNATFTPQVTYDGTNWFNLTDPGVLTLTATGLSAFPCNCLGAKQFRVLVQGSGTVTSSSATVTFGYRIAGGAV